MSTTTVIGIVLIALGAVGLIYGGITYTTSSNVLDMGGMHVQVDEKKQVPLSPIAGAVAVVAGVILVVVGRRKHGGGSAQ